MKRSAALLCCLLSHALTAHAQDFQWWSEIDLTASTKSVNLLAPIVARVDSELPNPQLLAAGVEADVRVAPHLTVAGGYLFADLPQRAQSHVHIPLIAATGGFHVGRAVIADRNRLERLVGYGNSPVRYRNRLLLDLPVGNGGWHAFGEDEIFFDATASRWSQNRFRVGGGRHVFGGISTDVFYLLRTVSGSSQRTHVFGTTFRLALTAPREGKQ